MTPNNNPQKEAPLGGEGQKENDSPQGLGSSTGDYCICPQCGEEVKNTKGISCRKQECPNCGSYMKRKN